MDAGIMDVTQVDDDRELLDLMLNDHEVAPDEYRATARWAEYSFRFVEYLKTEGLNNFRGKRHDKGSPGAVLSSFGANDRNPAFDRMGAKPEDMYHVARSSFRGETAVALEALPANRVGNPDGFQIDGRFFTLSWLNHYCRYAYATTFFDFKDQVIVEVGPGAGKQAEMLKRAHPDLTILLFDLPTQLYVCNQYLCKVFEGTGEVVDYRLGREVESFSDIQKGRINVLPHWKFPILQPATFDLLWNAASFQEMGPETASQYLSQGSGAKNMFLMHNIKYAGPNIQIGSRGVIDPKKLTTHQEVHRADARLALRPEYWLYLDSWWVKKSADKPKSSFWSGLRVRS